MPIYEYQCDQCGERVERLQRVDDPPPAACEACGGTMRKLVSAPAFQFKGSGWYVTDYGGRASADKGGSAESSGSEAGGKGAEGADAKADKPADKKPEAKSSSGSAGGSGSAPAGD